MNRKLFLLVALSLLTCELSFAQGTWMQKASLPDTARVDAMSFAIGTKGYVTQGSNVNMARLHSTWEYDATTNSWLQKQNFSGIARWQGVAFTIGTKGYIGTGQDNSSNYNNDLWEYDAATDTWTQKASMPTLGRDFAIGFAIGSKGYIGLGACASAPPFNDFWEFDATLNTWTQKASFPAPNGRMVAVGLSIGSKGYVGTGLDQTGTRYDDFWEYDPLTDSWTQKANFAGGQREEIDGAHFSVGNYGFIGTGRSVISSNWVYYNDFWKYNPLTDSWTLIQNLPAAPRIGASSFTINAVGYVGLGYNGFATAFNDLWSFTPDIANDVNEAYFTNSISIFPNPFSTQATLKANKILTNATLNIYNSAGKEVKEMKNISGQIITISRDQLAAGTYIIRVMENNKLISTAKLTVSD